MECLKVFPLSRVRLYRWCDALGPLVYGQDMLFSRAYVVWAHMGCILVGIPVVRIMIVLNPFGGSGLDCVLMKV